MDDSVVFSTRAGGVVTMADEPGIGRLAPYSRIGEALLSFSSTDASAMDTHPLRGLMTFGPYTKTSLAAHTDRVRVAIVGPPTGMRARQTLLRNVVAPQRPSDRREYVPPYPGFEQLFGVPLVPADRTAQLDLPPLLGTGEPQQVVHRLLAERLRQLADVRDAFDVAVIHLPAAWEAGFRTSDYDAHDDLKAMGAELAVPTQVITDRTFEFKYLASIAWRLAIALYVKAGGTPWKLAPVAGVPLDSAYIGLAYALRGGAEDTRFVTCCSQVFDADGGGMQFVAYDAHDPIDPAAARENPFLSRSDMRAVLARSLDLYRRRNGGNMPSRVVVHKTTGFTGEELAGASDALAAVNEVECIEITTNVPWRGVWLQPSRTDGRKSQPDRYPVHRGTMIPLDGRSALVWMAGNAPSVTVDGSSYFQGKKSIPSPLLMTRHMGRGALELIAAEALALTKMDWNNDALYDPVPVTIGYSQRLARTIANVPTLPRRVFPYRMFM